MSTPRKSRPEGHRKAADKRGQRSQSETLGRQQQIVLLHDVDRLTFREIAERIQMDEKSCRGAYHRYIREVSPLLGALANHDKVTAHLRQLEDIGQALWRVAATADNSSAAVGALRVLVEVGKVDIQLRQSLGLLPTAPRSLRDEHEKAWIGQQVAQLLHEVGAPAEALTRLEHILSGTTEEEQT